MFKGFTVLWLKKAQKQFDDLEKNVRNKITHKIDLLPTHPEQLDIKKLQGYADLYRITVADYRVIFKAISPSKIVIISFIAHRRDVYNKLSV